MYSLYLNGFSRAIKIAESENMDDIKNAIFQHNNFNNIAITNVDGLMTALTVKEINDSIDLAKVTEI